MITVLIVEDEKVIREGLEKHIAWNQLGVEQIYSAQQAEQAFDICDRVKPDIIVSDIRMPGINGIELCRRLREKYPDSQIIFVTGFADKEYLKAAISMHAISYVEKPVNVAELTEAVVSAVNQIQKSRSYEKAIVHSVFTHSDQIHYEWTKDIWFCVGLLYFKSPEEKDSGQISAKISQAAEKSGLHISVEDVDGRTEAFLFSAEKEMEESLGHMWEIIEAAVKGAKERCFFAAGYEIQGREAIKESYHAAATARESLCFQGWNNAVFSCVTYGKLNEMGIDKNWMEAFTRAVTRKEKTEALDIVENLSGELLKNRVIMDTNVKYLYYTMDNIVARYHRKENVESRRNKMEIEKAETIGELKNCICEIIEDSLESDEDNKNSYIVQKVTDYMLEHYMEKELSIKTLAEQVYLTPTYLSNLYKKHTGQTIGQYLVNIRMERAIDMLKDPQWKLYQIAPMVGYEDSNYFAKIFKKKTGVTPSEYREKMVQ